MYEGVKVKGVSKFRGFVPSNVIKVILTNGEVFKGLYAGTIEYPTLYTGNNPPQPGYYMVVYNPHVKKAQVVNMLHIAIQKKQTIQEVSATRLPKALSDYLRQYYKEYDKQQVELKKAYGHIQRGVHYTQKLKKLGQVELDEGSHQSIEQDLFRKHPEKRVNKKIMALDKEYYMAYDEAEDRYELVNHYWKLSVKSDYFGIEYYRESDGYYSVSDLPKPSQVEEYLKGHGKRVSLDGYKQLARKYKNTVQFSPDCFGAEVDEEHGNRFIPEVRFTFKVLKPSTFDDAKIAMLIKDIQSFIGR